MWVLQNPYRVISQVSIQQGHVDNQKQLEAFSHCISLSFGYFQTTKKPRSPVFEWNYYFAPFSSLLTTCPPLGHSCLLSAAVSAFSSFPLTWSWFILHWSCSHHATSDLSSIPPDHWRVVLVQGLCDKQNPGNDPDSCLISSPPSVGRACE